MNLGRIRYRAQQFWHAIHSQPDAALLQHANKILTPAEAVLFQRMHPSEQSHSLELMRKLIDIGNSSPDLLVAALLHDVGKSRYPLRLWERALIVLGRLAFPALMERWGHGSPASWKRPFVVAQQHPTWSAEMAAAAGASPLTIKLIRNHQEKKTTDDFGASSEEVQLLRRLQTFDEES